MAHALVQLQVCDRFGTFRTLDATVACKQAGLQTPGRAVGRGYYGSSTLKPMVDWDDRAALGCAGWEDRLEQVSIKATKVPAQHCSAMTGCGFSVPGCSAN